MLINKYSHKKEFIVHRFVKVQLEMHFICQYFNTLGSLLHLLVINFILHWGTRTTHNLLNSLLHLN